jgi:PIN domain nuclease of toxin-antitoxin system
MNRHVFDASAVLAILQREPGAEQAISVLESGECAISAANLAEVASRLLLRGMPPAQVVEACDALALEVVPVDTGIAMIAAQLAIAGQPLGLSLGDRCCLATAISLQARAVTADRVWASLHDPKVMLIR